MLMSSADEEEKDVDRKYGCEGKFGEDKKL
jgi:hypothetical protein